MHAATDRCGAVDFRRCVWTYSSWIYRRLQPRLQPDWKRVLQTQGAASRQSGTNNRCAVGRGRRDRDSVHTNTECANYFTACGYDPTWSGNAL